MNQWDALLIRAGWIADLKAIIFDWDLTLWNSWDIHVWLMAQTAQRLGQPNPSLPELAREFHRPFYEHLTWFFGENLEQTLEVYIGLYHQVVAEKAGLFPGIPELLCSLKERGYRLGIFSDKWHAIGVSELEQAGLSPLLDYTLFLQDERPTKPDPTGLLQVMETLEVAPAETLYIGDSHQDIDCARRAGVTSVAALWASLNREVVVARQPHHTLERVEHLLETLGL
ncbi:MAG: HAD family hydrolase [Dehalococcoidia bacterium]